MSLHTAFDPRSNSIGFLRLALALCVVVSHTFPLGGFNGGFDPLEAITAGRTSIGTLAVDGFFVLSGYLISRSFLSVPRIMSYFWRRALRIFPGYWVCLVITALVFAPLAWHKERGGFLGVFTTQGDTPIQYVLNNWSLIIGQWDIAGLFTRTPVRMSRGLMMMDGSLWTLKYEFLCYIGVGVLGLLALKLRRRVMLVLLATAVAVVHAAFLLWPDATTSLLLRADARLADAELFRLAFSFVLGAVLYVYSERIPISGRLAFLATVLMAVGTLGGAGFTVVGEVAAAYVWIWLVVRLPFTRADTRGDLSYGVYIYAWPVEQLCADYALNRWGQLPYLVFVLLGTLALAFLSWHLVERPALMLKRWSPASLWPSLSAQMSNPSCVSFSVVMRRLRPYCDSRHAPFSLKS